MFDILDSLTINHLTLIYSLISVSLIIYGLIPVIKLFRCGYNHPFSLPFFGTILWIYFKGLKCQIDWNRKYGQFYAVAQGQTLVLVISNPNYLKEILVKSFSNFSNRRIIPIPNKYLDKSVFMTRDEEWRLERRLILPTFTSHKMKHNMFPLISRCASRMIDHLKDSINSDLNPIHNKNDDQEIVVVDTKDIFGCYTMDVIASTAFGLDLDSHKENNHAFVRNAKKAFDNEITKPIFIVMILFPVIIPILNYFKISPFEESPLQFFADIVENTIEERKKFNIKRNDYLQLLLDSHDIYNSNQSNSNISLKENARISNINGSKKDIHKISDDMMTMNEEDSIETKTAENQNILTAGMSKEQYISNALLFFIAGYESTANALSWTARTLACYPEIQETLRNEIKQKISLKYTHFRPHLLNYDDIMSLKYLDQVIKEVMRLHPPNIFFDRMASEDFYLEDKLIKKGTVIEVPIYALHRDENIWSSPNEFDPDRFDPKNLTMEHQYSYMPFGFGPRNCVGSNIQFVIAPGDINSDLTPDNTKFKKNGTNFPENGIKVGVRYIEENYS
ncbi:unnamed protein product [Gordionus sp. m RMFG-2023]